MFGWVKSIQIAIPLQKPPHSLLVGVTTPTIDEYGWVSGVEMAYISRMQPLKKIVPPPEEIINSVNITDSRMQPLRKIIITPEEIINSVNITDSRMRPVSVVSAPPESTASGGMTPHA